MNNYIGITIGDPSGIGPEISLKALVKNKDYLNESIIFGSKEIMAYYANLLKIKIPLNFITDVDQFERGKINIYNVLDIPLEKIPTGKVSPVSGDAAFQFLKIAINLAMKKKIGPVVTAPLNKDALHKGGHNYDGHTEIFAKFTGTEKYTMMLWSPKLAVVHVSTHVPLRKACDLVTKVRVEECIDLANNAMKRLGIENPKIAVAGLNPHAGENGLFGDEEIKEINPAVRDKQAQGVNVNGALPPDTVFLKASQGQFDIVVAMYHDQGHIPMKLLAFDEGVNVTLGLPIIRTSVDHGTAFDIAGKGIANESSMLASIALAIKFSHSA
ncbi:MAG: 4-hydroxythreonine-4-phosphate dehydrogenase PdxA [Lacticaseibacillus rhamnosus]